MCVCVLAHAQLVDPASVPLVAHQLAEVVRRGVGLPTLSATARTIDRSSRLSHICFCVALRTSLSTLRFFPNVSARLCYMGRWCGQTYYARSRDGVW